MSNPESDRKFTLDILGSKAVTDAAKKVVDTSVDGVATFLNVICMPAAEEFGLLLKDRISAVRRENQMKVLIKAEKLWNTLNNKNFHAHPRLVGAILGHSGWEDDDEVQNMWAGLIASSCNESGKSQENFLFINLLGQITSSQAKLLNYLCYHCEKRVYSGGLLTGSFFNLPTSKIFEITNIDEIYILDMQIDHLRELGLLISDSSLILDSIEIVNATPSAVAIMLYVRSQGFVGSPAEFFGFRSDSINP